MNTHVVVKPLPSGRETLTSGTEVDASAWRNARLLEEQRYIRPLTATESQVGAGQTQPNERTARVGRKGRDEPGN